jgi:hypothetical protein
LEDRFVDPHDRSQQSKIDRYGDDHPDASHGTGPQRQLQPQPHLRVFVPPALLAQMDRRADRKQVRAGRSTSRADVIRSAMLAYVAAQGDA